MIRVRLTAAQVRAIRLVDEASVEDGNPEAIRLLDLIGDGTCPVDVDLDFALTRRLMESTLPEVIDRCKDWGFEGAGYVRSAQAAMRTIARTLS